MKTIKKHKLKSLLILSISLFIVQPTSVYAFKAPKFFLSNIDGERFYSKKSNNILISFFFTGCIPCRKEIPQLYKMVMDENLNTALLFINPLKDETPDQIREFAEKLGVPTEYFYHDSMGRLAGKFKIKDTFPTIVGVSRNRIRFKVNDLSEESIARIRKTFK